LNNETTSPKDSGLNRESIVAPVQPIVMTSWASQVASRNSMWTYFIVGGPYVKIGSAIRPLRRLKELQTGCPFDLELVAVSDKYEYGLHDQFRRLRTRMNGEWFEWQCGTIHRWLCNQWFKTYGDSHLITEDKVREIAGKFGVPEQRIRDFVAPYSEFLTEGAFKLAMDERTSCRTGMRLFRSS
jgi:hypothetical protein